MGAQAQEPGRAHNIDCDDEFKRCYRMDKATFAQVLRRVGPHLQAEAHLRGDQLEPDVAPSLGLR
jgi:hypothetical protein